MLAGIFLEHYRITGADKGTPVEISRNGPAVTYKGTDLKTGAPVALTIIPIASVDPAEREQFETKAQTAMLLDHVNIARTAAFGRTDDSFVFVSEHPLGETVEEWVKANGPMPADAVLRIALQVTAALSAASFHSLTHPAIQPGNLAIVSGKTAEGGWPHVKLTQFALAGLKSARNHADPDLSASDFAGPEQLLQGKIDFRSEMYSLGATMCFLLTGVFYSAYPRSPQTKRFARPLRTLIARTLEDDPDLRPQDPVLFMDELRTCLATIERRQALQRRFGIPFSPVARPPRQRRLRLRQRRPTSLLAPVGTTPVPPEPAARWPRFRPVWAIVGLLFALAVIAALFLPEDVVTAALHRKKSIESIGVPVGVPETSPVATVAQAAPAPVPAQQRPAAAPSSIALSESAQQAGKSPIHAGARSPAATDTRIEPPPVTITQHANGAAHAAIIAANAPPASAQPRTEQASKERISEAAAEPTTASSAPLEPNGHPVVQATPTTVVANHAAPEPAAPAEAPVENARTQGSPATEASEPPVAANDQPDSEVAQSNADVKKAAPTTSSHTAKARTKRPSTVTESRGRTALSRVPRALPVGPRDEPDGSGTFRARVVGVTPNGNVILALPNGERAIVSPQDADQYSRTEPVRRRPKRVIIERRTFIPQYPPYQPFLPPDA